MNSQYKKRIKPAPNSLAILRTCSQINQEARGLWLGQVLFKFECQEEMLDNLSALPSTTLSQIRHICVSGYSISLKPIGEDHPVTYSLVWVLKLLPALYLDTLTVIDSNSGAFSYDALGGLVKYGNGWKQLHFITPNSDMLGFQRLYLFTVDELWRKPQPSTWNKILMQQDGVDSGASVTIYRSIQPYAPGTVIKPENRQLFEQKPPPSDDLQMFGEELDGKLLCDGRKELLVVVSRGHHASILRQDSPPYMDQDIRQWAHGFTWAEIRDQCYFLSESYETIEADRYNDIDEYAWY